MRDLRDSAHGGPGIGCHSMASLQLDARYGHSPLFVSVG